MTRCEECGGNGYYKLAVPVGHPAFGQLHKCVCIGGTLVGSVLHAAVPTAQPLSAADLYQQRLLTYVSELGELAHCSFGSFNTRRPVLETLDGCVLPRAVQWRRLAKAKQAALSYASELAGSFWLSGPNGGGKSHLAAAIGYAALEAGWRVAYASLRRLLSFIRDGYQDHSASERRVLFEQIDVAVLDDLEPLDVLSNDEGLLFEVVNARYLRGLPTIYTSNWHLDEQPPRIRSRILGMTTEERRVELIVSDIRALPTEQRAAI